MYISDRNFGHKFKLTIGVDGVDILRNRFRAHVHDRGQLAEIDTMLCSESAGFEGGFDVLIRLEIGLNGNGHGNLKGTLRFS